MRKQEKQLSKLIAAIAIAQALLLPEASAFDPTCAGRDPQSCVASANCEFGIVTLPNGVRCSEVLASGDQNSDYPECQKRTSEAETNRIACYKKAAKALSNVALSEIALGAACAGDSGRALLAGSDCAAANLASCASAAMANSPGPDRDQVVGLYEAASRADQAAAALYNACAATAGNTASEGVNGNDEFRSLCSGMWRMPGLRQFQFVIQSAQDKNCGNKNSANTDQTHTTAPDPYAADRQTIGPANGPLIDKCHKDGDQAACAKIRQIVDLSRQQMQAQHATAAGGATTANATAANATAANATVAGVDTHGSGGTNPSPTPSATPGNNGSGNQDSGDLSDTGAPRKSGSASDDLHTVGGIPGLPGGGDADLAKQIDNCIRRNWSYYACPSGCPCSSSVSQPVDQAHDDAMAIARAAYGGPSQQDIDATLQQADIYRQSFEDQARAVLVRQLGLFYGRYTASFDFPAEARNSCAGNPDATLALRSFPPTVPPNLVFQISDEQVDAAIGAAENIERILNASCPHDVCRYVGDGQRARHILAGMAGGVAQAERSASRKAKEHGMFATALLLRGGSMLPYVAATGSRWLDMQQQAALTQYLNQQPFLSAGYSANISTAEGAENVYSGLSVASFPVVQGILAIVHDSGKYPTASAMNQAVKDFLDSHARNLAKKDLGKAIAIACDPDQLPWYQLINMGDELFKGITADPKLKAVLECYKHWYHHYTKNKEMVNLAVTAGCIFAPFIPGAGPALAVSCATFFAGMSASEMPDANNAAVMAAAAAPAGAEGGPVSNGRFLGAVAAQNDAATNTGLNLLFAAAEVPHFVDAVEAMERASQAANAARGAGRRLTPAEQSAKAQAAHDYLALQDAVKDNPERFGIAPSDVKDVLAHSNDPKAFENALKEAQARRLQTSAPITPEDARRIVDENWKHPPSNAEAGADHFGGQLARDSRRAVGEVAAKWGITDPAFVDANVVPGRSLKQVEEAAEARALHDYAASHGASEADIDSIAHDRGVKTGDVMGRRLKLTPTERAALDAGVKRLPEPPQGTPDLREIRVLAAEESAIKKSPAWGKRLWEARVGDSPEALADIEKQLEKDGADSATAKRIVKDLKNAKGMSLDSIAELFDKHLKGACGVP